MENELDFPIACINLLKRYAGIVQNFRTQDYHDDRLLFVNKYQMLQALSTETPLTEAGKIAISKFAITKASELVELYHSLKRRDMLK